MIRHKVTRREMDSILAGLRLSQHDSAWIADGDGMIRNIAEDHGDALTNTEIDALCEKLNCPDEKQSHSSSVVISQFTDDELKLIIGALAAVEVDNDDDDGSMACDLSDRFRQFLAGQRSTERTPTEQKGLDYLNNRGAACPHCGGIIEGGSMNFEAGEICQRVYCTDCQEKWQDVYKLTAVVTEDGELIASIPIPEEKR